MTGTDFSSPRSKPRTHSKKELSEAALKGFFTVAKVWGLSVRDQSVLLGRPSQPTFTKWQKEPAAVLLSEDTMERISYVLGIWKALRILIPDDGQATAWVKTPNDNPMFEGRPPLERMLRGRVLDLADIKRLLSARIGTW